MASIAGYFNLVKPIKIAVFGILKIQVGSEVGLKMLVEVTTGVGLGSGTQPQMKQVERFIL